MTQQNVATPARPEPSGEITAPPPAAPGGPPRLNNLQLFLIFSQMSLMGFGGVMPQAFHQMVEKRKLVTAAEFSELLVFCQIMPGPTICTLSLVYGQRQNGVPGAIAGALGMTFFPLVFVLILGVLYQNFNDIVVVQSALKGMAVVAAGLFASTGLKLLLGLPRRWLPWGIAAALIAVVSYWRIPIPLALLIAAPIAVWLQYRRERAADAGTATQSGKPGAGQ